MTSRWHDTKFRLYHERTKHTRLKLMSDAWYLDWANQPNPFRHWLDAPVIPLPTPAKPPANDYFHPRAPDHSAPLTLDSISQFLYHSMAISAWKVVPGTDVRWSLRVNPSSGNLHPTETHLILSGVDGIEDGVYHFRVDTFALAARYQGPVCSILGALHRHTGLEFGSVTFLLSSIFWREAWKYRDRAFRYCHHDLGHALRCVTDVLRGLGHEPRSCHLFDDAQVARWAGLDGSDERPGLLITIGEPVTVATSIDSPPEFGGRPNALSEELIDYPSIAMVAEATAHRTLGSEPERVFGETRGLDEAIPLVLEGTAQREFWECVRTRRSGVAFDGETGISSEDLGLMLHRATAGERCDVYDFTRPADGRFHIHLYLHIHRVDGIEPGLYHYNREQHALQPIRKGDQRGWAASLSLGQDIAADSAFAVSMIADFESAAQRFGERGYRAVHIEAGHVGQGLYIGAESIGVNATGIGAFFDDEVNAHLELPHGIEVVYHFTVGRAVPDPRVRALPSYGFEFAR